MAKTDTVRLEAEAVDVEYDEQADVLYVAFGSEREADDSELTDNDILIRFKDGMIVGLTVLHFSERRKAPQK